MNVRKFLRVYTTYLRLKGSVWEADWKILREYSFNNSNNKTVDFGHDRIIHTTIFIWLTIFVFLFPILLWVYSLLPFNNIADNKTIFHNFSIDYNKENLKSLENILGLFFLFLQTLFGFIYLFKIREGHKKPDKDDSEIEKAMKKALEEKC
nr:hypothetical protein [Pyrinomonadaceae bacterium]